LLLTWTKSEVGPFVVDPLIVFGAKLKVVATSI
jgi:hypothetical protein